MEDENKVSPVIIKNLFKSVHEDYCSYFKKFQKNLDLIFQENLTNEESNQIIEWIREYKNSMEYSMQTLDDFEEQIKNQRLTLSDQRLKDNEIFEEIKNAVMPIAIVYWVALMNKNN